MIKIVAALFQDPLVVLLHALLGASFMIYFEDAVYQAVLWFIPCAFVILADLVSGIRAARYRKESVRMSSALRRTLNKCLCYVSWIIVCVGMNKQYGTHWVAWVGMGAVFLIEGISFFSNLLEPHGLKLSVTGILRVIGGKFHVDNLDDIIDKEK